MLLVIGVILTACLPEAKEPIIDPQETIDSNDEPIFGGSSIFLVTTKDINDSGLLDYLIPIFTQQMGIRVKITSTDLNEALQMGRDGEADVLLVDSLLDEIKFIEDGHGVKRYDVMYSELVLVGPKDDTNIFKEKNGILETLKAIAEMELNFISSSSNIQIQNKVNSIWGDININPGENWYISTDAEVDDLLKLVEEKRGYTIIQKSNFLIMKDDIDLDIIIEDSKELVNQYGIIPINPTKSPIINELGSLAFTNWIIFADTQKLIGEFRVDNYGESIYIPNYK